MRKTTDSFPLFKTVRSAAEEHAQTASASNSANRDRRGLAGALGNRGMQLLLSEQSNPKEHANTSMPATMAHIPSSGQALDAGNRAHFERGFATDLSNVGIHTDASAASSAASLDANAYAKNGEIHFGENRYRPGTPDGRKLLFHEVAHVAQQRNPGATASKDALEREANGAAESALAGNTARVKLSAPASEAQCQKTNWKTGDVILTDQTSIGDVKNKGGLFSGNDQSHVTVSARGKLAYDADHTAPEDPFRWSKLKDIIDNAHLKIKAVSVSDKFKVKPKSSKTSIDTSISEIRMDTNDLSAQGIALMVGDMSPDPTYDMIYYNKDGGIGALTHELFGHEWLSTQKAPWQHPPIGSAEEQTVGTIEPSNQVRDPFGNIYSGTVRKYIATYIESLASNVTAVNSLGATVTVPKSPTQGVGKDASIKAFDSFYKEATGSGLTVTKTQTGVQTRYSPAIAQQWRNICDSYDLMPTNQAAIAAGNSDLTFTKEIVSFLCVFLFTKLSEDQKKAFRVLVSDFTASRGGFKPNDLSNLIEKAVGGAPSVFSP
jgi:Domain of unknown function (DUF4157)